MSEIKYVYVRTPVFRKAYKNTYMIRIVDDKTFKDEPHGKGCTEKVFSLSEFSDYCAKAEFLSIALVLRNQSELDFFADAFAHKEIGTLEPHFPDRAKIDLEPLSKLEKVNRFFLVELPKIEKLWNAKENKSLKILHILNCNSLHDFSCLEGSTIETLQLFGCNGLSSFTSKLHIDDFSFVLKMPELKSLHIEIVKDQPAIYYINIITQMKNLREFMCPESFLTFEQFAYLAAKLPECKGLECSLYCKELGTYSIIGNRKPRFLRDRERIKKYERQYEQLIDKFKKQPYPPV